MGAGRHGRIRRRGLRAGPAQRGAGAARRGRIVSPGFGGVRRAAWRSAHLRVARGACCAIPTSMRSGSPHPITSTKSTCAWRSRPASTCWRRSRWPSPAAARASWRIWRAARAAAGGWLSRAIPPGAARPARAGPRRERWARSPSSGPAGRRGTRDCPTPGDSVRTPPAAGPSWTSAPTPSTPRCG